MEVSWTLLPPDGVDRLTLVWGESGGPRPQPPAKLGFGVSFMKRSVEYELQGSVELTFEPSGLRCKIEFPLRNNADHRSAGESDAGRNGQ